MQLQRCNYNDAITTMQLQRCNYNDAITTMQLQRCNQAAAMQSTFTVQKEMHESTEQSTNSETTY
jgi:hypothetical protein